VVYVGLYNAAPHEEWGGDDGTIRCVMTDLNISRGSRWVVKEVFEEVQAVWADGREWSPENGKKKNARHTSQKVKLNTAEAQIVADAMEGGLGLTQATALVNEYLASAGRPHVGRSSFYSNGPGNHAHPRWAARE
jgi:hypothetical protein